MASQRKKIIPPEHWWKTLDDPKWQRTNWRSKWLMVFRLFRERSAFLYEVGARVNAKKGVPVFEFAKPWISLPVAKKRLLARRWPMPNTEITSGGGFRFTDGVMSLAGIHDKPEEGWTTFRNVSYNLRYNNETIVQSLLRFIAQERTRLGFPNPKPNKGRRHRKRSWRPIEVMDRKFDSGEVSRSETSQVSKAKREYKESLRHI